MESCNWFVVQFVGAAKGREFLVKLVVTSTFVEGMNRLPKWKTDYNILPFYRTYWVVWGGGGEISKLDTHMIRSRLHYMQKMQITVQRKNIYL